MKLIISGGRDFSPTLEDKVYLHDKLSEFYVTEVVCGGCRGADKFGKDMAEFLRIPVRIFNADWNKHGKAAGPIRNRQMAEYADALLTFDGCRGTSNMIKEAETKGLQILNDT